MKPAQSHIIKEFLNHIDKGYITGRENTSGTMLLETIANAMREILAGADPDTALSIKRSSGPQLQPKTAALALLIHQYRKAGEKWAVIELLANQWREEQQLEPVTLGRLKGIHKDNREWLEQIDNASAVVKWVIREDDKRAKKK